MSVTLNNKSVLTLIRVGNPTEKKRQILTLVVDAVENPENLWGHKTIKYDGQRVFMSVQEGFTGIVGTAINFNEDSMKLMTHEDEEGEKRYWLSLK